MSKSLKFTLLLSVFAIAGLLFVLTGCKDKREHPTGEHPTKEAVACCGSDPSKCCGKAAAEKANEHPTKEAASDEHPAGEHPK